MKDNEVDSTAAAEWKRMQSQVRSSGNGRRIAIVVLVSGLAAFPFLLLAFRAPPRTAPRFVIAAILAPIAVGRLVAGRVGLVGYDRPSDGSPPAVRPWLNTLRWLMLGLILVVILFIAMTEE